MGRIAEHVPLERRAVYRTVFLFGLANGLAFLLNGLAYLPPASAHAAETAFKYIVYVSHFLSLALVFSLILLLLYALLRSALTIKLLSVLLFSLAQMFVFVDVRVYIHYKFHFSGIVVEAMFNPGYWDSMHFEARDQVFVVLAVAGLLAAEFALFTIMHRFVRRGGRLWKATRARFTLPLAAFILIVSFGEKVVYGICDAYNRSEITQYGKIFPLYFPFTFREWYDEKFGTEELRRSVSVPIPTGGQLSYPLPGYRSGALPRPHNVVMIMMEGTRFDMLSEEVMPNLSRFGRRAVVCRNHYSAGNTSRFGSFGFFYGLYGTYWHQFLNNRGVPVLMKRLLDNGYRFKIMSSTSLSYPELDRTAFADLGVEIEDEFPGEDSCERDDLLVCDYLDWLKNVPRDRPFFTFIFLDSPHATYFFKTRFKKFEPCRNEVSFIKTNLREDREKIFNRYRNAVHYMDDNIGRIIRALDGGGFLDETIVVVTGDHGEEFWEHDYYGHNSAYTEYQVKVPLLLWVPGVAPGEIDEMTCHLDVPATILRALGDQNDTALYSLGYDLLGPERPEFLVLSGWDDCCLVTPKLKMRFYTEAYTFFRGGVTDLDDQTVTDRRLIREEKDRYLMPALQGMSRFFK